MATNRDIRRLLKKGLTGWEAGLLAFESFWLEEHGQESFLSDTDLESLKAGILKPRDRDDYNALIRLYRTADFIERQATIALLGATAILERAAGLGYLRMAPIVASHIQRRLPAIVTEKQYQEIQAKQRESKLQEHTELYHVLHNLAMDLASEEQEEQAEGYLQAYPEEIRAELADSLLDPLRAGQLKPVQLSQEDSKALSSLEEQLDTLRDKRWPPGRSEEEMREAILKRRYSAEGWTPRDEEDFDSLLQQQAELQKQSLERARPLEPAILIAFLEKLKDGSLSEEDWQAIPPAYFSMAELYQAGHPGAVSWVDEFTPSLEEAAPAPAYAILQEPPAYMLDEQGHYKEWMLEEWPFAPMDVDLPEVQSEARQTALEQIGKLLARRQVLEEISHYLGLSLSEFTDYGISSNLEPAISRHNTLAETVQILHGWPQSFLDAQDYRPIKWEELEPPEDELAKVRAWVSLHLEDGWWEKARHKEPRSILKLSEEASHGS